MADKEIAGKDEGLHYDDPTGRKSDLLAAFDAVESKTAAPAKEVKPAVIPEMEEAEEIVAQEAASPEGEEVVAEQEPAQEPVKNEFEPPKNWKKADKEEFSLLPDEAKRIVLARERERDADYTKKTMEIADFRKEYGAIDEMFKPFKGTMQANGFTPSQLVHSWMNVEQELMAGGERASRVVQEVAKAYKIDLGQFAATSKAQPAPAQEGAKDPALLELENLLGPIVTPLRQQVETMQGKLTQYEQSEQSRATQQQQARVTEVVNQIQAFASHKGADGELTHPYFSEVESTMGVLASGYKSLNQPIPSLEDLYQQAVQATPSTRAKLTEAQQQLANINKLKEARAKSTQAKRAGSSVTGSPGLATVKPNGRDPSNASIRDVLNAAVEDLQLQ